MRSGCRDAHSVKRDQFGEALEKRREEIPRWLVHEAKVGVELLVRVPDEDLRLQQCIRVGEYE